MTLVSIIIPAYNRAHLIVKTIESIQAQTHTDWECIIVDDGSTDETEEVVIAFAKADSRISYHKRPDTSPKGANACRNYGFKQSKGAYINWFDSDDLMRPQKLERQLALLENTTMNYCICQTERIDSVKGVSFGLRSDRIHSETPLDDYLTFEIFWSILAPLWKRSFLDTNRLHFDESLQQSQEYEFHARALAIDRNYIPTDDVLCEMISHGENMSVHIDDHPEKLISNLKVRYTILKNLNTELLPETKVYLFRYLFSMYKEALLHKQIKKAYIIWPFLKKSIAYVPEIVALGRIRTMKWSLARWSFAVFGKGESLLKFMS